MARRKSSEPLTKITLNIYSRDIERLHEIYPNIGHTVAIRAITRAHITGIEAKIARETEALVAELDLDEIDLEEAE